MTSRSRDLGGYRAFFSNEPPPAAVEAEPESAPEAASPIVPVWQPPEPDAEAGWGGVAQPSYAVAGPPSTSAAPTSDSTLAAVRSLRGWDVTPAVTGAIEEVVLPPAVIVAPAAEADPAADLGQGASDDAEVEAKPAAWPAPMLWSEPVARAEHDAVERVSPASAPAALVEPATAEQAVHVVDRAADLISMKFATSSVLEQLTPLERAKPQSTQGVRGAMNRLGFRFGLSAAEQRAERRRALIRTQVTAPHQIAVMSVKGGVGRTTMTAALGSTFASIRADRVVAVEAGGGFGDLAARTRAHPQGLNMQDLARGNGLDSFAAVQAFATTNSADLDVVASPWSSAADVELTAAEYAYGFAKLRKHYNLMLADCGTALADPATVAVLSTSHSVLMVTSATVGGVSGAVATLNWLFSHGLRQLVAKTVVALVHQRADHPVVDMDEVENVFATARRPTVVIPFDPHLAEGGEIDLRLLRAQTRLAFEELAANLVAHFPSYREAMR